MIFGWDISTAIIGLSIFTNDGKYVSSHFFDLRKEKDRDLHSLAEVFEGQLEAFMRRNGGDLWWTNQKDPNITQLPPSVHYIEDRLAGFTRGFSNQGTLMKLGAFNYLVGWIAAKRIGMQGLGLSKVVRIHPATVRSVMAREGLVYPEKMKGDDKKIVTTEFVATREPTFPLERTKAGKPKPFCFDMADSYVVARTGILKGRIVTHGAGTEDGGGKKRPRKGKPSKG